MKQHVQKKRKSNSFKMSNNDLIKYCQREVKLHFISSHTVRKVFYLIIKKNIDYFVISVIMRAS